jgi:hypothetical protein
MDPDARRPAPGAQGIRWWAVLLVVAIVAAGYWLWPSEEREIRRRLGALTDLVNERPRDGLAMVAHTAQLATFFANDVVVDPGHRSGQIRGRERVLALASRAPATAAEFHVGFVDVSVQVTGEQASSRMTATLTSRNDPAEPATVDAREVDVQWRREDEWRIVRVTLIDPLEKPEP